MCGIHNRPVTEAAVPPASLRKKSHLLPGNIVTYSQTEHIQGKKEWHTALGIYKPLGTNTVALVTVLGNLV